MAILRSAGARALTSLSQEGRLAAARRADQHDEFAVVDGEVDVDEHARRVVTLVQLVDAQVRHRRCDLT
jgi:hypothetical protein